MLPAGGCPAAHQQVQYTITDTTGVCLAGSTVPELPPPSGAVHCDGHKMTAGSTWLGLAGLAIIGVLMHRQVRVSPAVLRLLCCAKVAILGICHTALRLLCFAKAAVLCCAEAAMLC